MNGIKDISFVYNQPQLRIKFMSHIKRILIYTHNSMGMGHAFRTIAVITGIKKWRNDLDFLVISGTSVPHIFFREGIDVVKLPGIKMVIGDGQNSLEGRYLRNIEPFRIFDYRQKIILETFDFFRPHVLMVEHNMGGLMNEIVPLMIRKKHRISSGEDFALVHLSRGIFSGSELVIPHCNMGGNYINIAHLYDFIYVFEKREIVDINLELLGNDPELEDKITYHGPITFMTSEDLSDRKEVKKNFALSNKPVILIAPGRYGRIEEMIKSIISSFEILSLERDYEIILIPDPYLEKERLRYIKESILPDYIRIIPFTFNFVDLMNYADLVISRGGYNTVNELLLTESKALIIPECHPSREQERRVSLLPEENIVVKSEDEIISGKQDIIILELLKGEKKSLPFENNKYSAGLKIMEDLEKWTRDRYGR